MQPFNPMASSFLDECDENGLPIELKNHSALQFSFAFQPIVDAANRRIYAHEALVRGPACESAASVLAQLSDAGRYRFDEACHTKAIKLAASIGMLTKLSLNVLPNGIDHSDVWLQSTSLAVTAHAFTPGQIILETTENEKIKNVSSFASTLHEFRRLGFLTAIDDFGAGYSGLELFADFQPDLVKLDIALVRDIQKNRPRQIIAKAVVEMCTLLGIQVIAEGVETADQFECLRDLGITLMQGYFFSRPIFQACAVNLVDADGTLLVDTPKGLL